MSDGCQNRARTGASWPCEADGCLGRGHGKAYCSQHVYLMPYAQEIRAELERQRRNARARAKTAAKRAS